MFAIEENIHNKVENVNDKKLYNIGFIVIVICTLLYALEPRIYLFEMDQTTKFFYDFMTYSPFVLGAFYLKLKDEKFLVPGVVISVALYDIFNLFFIKIPFKVIIIQIVVVIMYIIYVKWISKGK